MYYCFVMNISGRSLITFLKFEMEVLHARQLPQAELSSSFSQ